MVIEVGVVSLVIAASAARCEAGERVLSINSLEPTKFTICGSLEPNLLFSVSLENAIAGDFSLIPDVQSVFVERAEGNLLVWIGVDNPTREVRERVFQKQFDIVDGFPEVSFDFNLIAGKNRDANEFASEAKLIYSRQG